MFIDIAIGFLVGIPVGIIVYFLVRHFIRRAFFESLQVSVFLVKVPKAKLPQNPTDKDVKNEINKFEQLLGNLGALKKPFIFEVAVPHVGEEIHFYLGVSRNQGETAVKQIQGLWNGASVEILSDDYNIFNAQGNSAGAYIAEKRNYSLPVRTYEEIGADTFSSIISGFTKVNEVGEGAALQLIIRPASPGTKKNISHQISRLKKGESVDKVLGQSMPFVAELGEIVNPGKIDEKDKGKNIVDDDAVKAMEAKISKPLFEVNARIIASAGSPFQAGDILEGLTAGFSQLASPRRNEFRIVKPKNQNKLIYQFVFRNFDAGQSMVLNSEEIASFYHFPTAFTETPRVKWLKSKEAPPSAGLASEGVFIGQSAFRGQIKPIYISDDDRRRHIYMIGQTGTGKSTLMANMIIDDIKKGKGVAMIDPHGDLVETVLGHIPKNRIDDLVHFDPADLWRPLGLNMLDYNPNRPEEKTFIVNEMQGIFNKLFPPETMGPMFEQYMRNALLLLMEDMPNEPATLIEVPRVFTDPEYRKRKLARIHNLTVVDFWEKEAAKAGGDASLANMTPYITSKFNNFISNDYMRPIIGQPRSAFNFREVMDGGKILLINLSKGRIGDINAGLLGMIISGKILMAALSRVDIPDQSQRRDFNFYIDEFQNFTTDSISTILSEARKYRLSLTMAHQFIAQLNDKIKDAVFGNVGSQIVFRVGVQDAEFLVKQFEPVFDENDLMSIDNFNAYVKILVKGETAKPFNIKTLPMEHGNAQLAHELKEYSRNKYGQDKQIIEEEIRSRLRG